MSKPVKRPIGRGLAVARASRRRRPWGKDSIEATYTLIFKLDAKRPARRKKP